MIQPTAAKGFANGAEAYERGRPGYPADAVAYAVAEAPITPSSFVVDLGAGTGKWTRLLVPTGARLLAVEPVAEMRDVFAKSVPGVEVVDGTAEAIPADDASVDVVTGAQMFHWVDAVPAIEEVHRVLKPDGALVLVWNGHDADRGWPVGIQELLDTVVGGAPQFGSANDGGWRTALAAHGGFLDVEMREFRHEHRATIESMVDRVASTSYVAALPAAERERILGETRRIAAEAGLGDTFVERYLTEVNLCRKR